MFVLLLAALVTAQPLVQPQPSAFTSVRDGRQAEVRFINRLSPLVNTNINGVAYNSQTVVATLQIGSNTNADTITSNPGGVPAFEEIDVGAGGVATFTLRLQTTPTAQIISCGGGATVLQSERVTFVLSQTATPPTLVTGGCTATGPMGSVSGTCVTTTVQAPGTVTVTCETIKDSLTTPRNCATVPVRVFSENPACPVLLERADLESGTLETFDTSVTVPTVFGTTGGNNPLNLDRATEFELNDVTVFAPVDDSRFREVFISSSGVVSQGSTLKTAFLNVANAAFRTSTVGMVTSRDNVFLVVVSQSSALPSSANADQVVHVGLVQPGQAMGWIEVPADPAISYNLFVYDNDVTEAQIFGDNSLAMPSTMTPGLVPITQSAAPLTLSANEMRIFRILNTLGSIATFEVNSVPLNGGSFPLATSGIPADTTRFIVWNSINNAEVATVKLASPDSQCCNFLADGDSLLESEQTAQSGVTGDANTISPNPRNADNLPPTIFSVFPSSATCTSLGSPLVPAPATVSLVDATGDGQCAVEGHILIGRLVSFTETVPTGCTTPPTQTVTTTRVAALNNDNLINPGTTTDISIEFPVALCSCFVAATPCRATPCLGTEFDTLAAAIVASTNAISGSIASSTASINANVDATDGNIVNTNSTLHSVFASNTADLRNRISSVQSTVNGLSSSTGNDANEILDEVDNVLSDIKKIRKDIGNLEDEVKDIECKK